MASLPPSAREPYPTSPALEEAGVPGYEFPIWYGVWAPAGTPTATVERLARDITWAISQPSVHDWLVEHGMEPLSMTPEAFARFVVDETHRALRTIKASRSAHP